MVDQTALSNATRQARRRSAYWWVVPDPYGYACGNYGIGDGNRDGNGFGGGGYGGGGYGGRGYGYGNGGNGFGGGGYGGYGDGGGAW
jgi:hypothetical protein